MSYPIPLRVDLPCDVEPSPEAVGPLPSAPAANQRGLARKCASFPSQAQLEAIWRAYWLHQQLKLMELAEEGGRQEVRAMCARIAARRAAGIPDPIEHKPNEATSDYQSERDAGWDWRV